MLYLLVYLSLFCLLPQGCELQDDTRTGTLSCSAHCAQQVNQVHRSPAIYIYERVYEKASLPRSNSWIRKLGGGEETREGGKEGDRHAVSVCWCAAPGGWCGLVPGAGAEVPRSRGSLGVPVGGRGRRWRRREQSRQREDRQGGSALYAECCGRWSR